MNTWRSSIQELGDDIKKAEYAINVRRYDLAIELLQRMLAQHPENSIAYYTLARAYALQKKESEMRAAILESLRLDPSFGPAHRLYAAWLRDHKEYAQAEHELQTAIALGPTREQAHYFYADLLLVCKKDLAGAREHCQKALELDPERPAFHDLAARIFVAEGDLEQAEAAYLHALRLDPEYADTHNNYGKFLLSRRNNPRAAFEHFRIALMQKPDDATMKRNFLIALKAKNRFYWLFWQYALLRRKLGRFYVLLLVAVILAVRVSLALSQSSPVFFVIASVLIPLYLLFLLYAYTINPFFDFCIKRGWIK